MLRFLCIILDFLSKISDFIPVILSIINHWNWLLFPYNSLSSKMFSSVNLKPPTEESKFRIWRIWRAASFRWRLFYRVFFLLVYLEFSSAGTFGKSEFPYLFDGENERRLSPSISKIKLKESTISSLLQDIICLRDLRLNLGKRRAVRIYLL